ncbi:MAG TPA: hypothetical protein VGO11_26400 [Chthoniobacteraceae bacterium]|jgi:hypothetical protein|nr:hypothetical protein [Chthoniobacteraceae bacterium]
MAIPKVIPKQLPMRPGKNSRYTLKRAFGEWWVHYQSTSGDIAADQPHPLLAERINRLKLISHDEGGSFSINEHSQVIARMKGPTGSDRDSIHVVDIGGGAVFAYPNVITFQNGALDPTSILSEGTPWTGPLCGSTYTFSISGKRDNTSGQFEEILIKDSSERLSQHVSGIPSYPPPQGPLAEFLAALRRVLPGGGRFRINEHRRVFTSNPPHFFVGIAPPSPLWFRPIPAFP